MKQRMTPYRTRQKAVSSMRIVTFKVDEELLILFTDKAIPHKLLSKSIVPAWPMALTPLLAASQNSSLPTSLNSTSAGSFSIEGLKPFVM